MNKTVIVGVQHVLETTVTLFDSLIKLGIKPENMYFTGKCYSTSVIIAHEIRHRGIHFVEDYKPERPGTFKEAFAKQLNVLWEKVVLDLSKKLDINRIIVLDDGGCCLETVPNFLRFKYPIVGIEQTRGGLYSEAINVLPFPLIEVATCATKKYLESPLIAEAVLKKVESYLARFLGNARIVCGVVGNGAIGGGFG